jgi:predicted nucleotidyltransferase
MRLTEEQRRIVRDEVTRIFGPGALVRLFGSRVDDHARGGDIDLHIEAIGTPAELLERELRLQARLVRRLGDRCIDVVVHGRDQPLRPIDEHARQTGVAL